MRRGWSRLLAGRPMVCMHAAEKGPPHRISLLRKRRAGLYRLRSCSRSQGKTREHWPWMPRCARRLADTGFKPRAQLRLSRYLQHQRKSLAGFHAKTRTSPQRAFYSLPLNLHGLTHTSRRYLKQRKA